MNLRRGITTLCLLCLAASSTWSATDSSKPAPPPPAILLWKNGETLSGEVTEASNADISWKSPLFQDPLVLRWPAVRRFDQTLPSTPSPDPFAFVLRDGSHLYGNLLSIDGDKITIQSTRLGEAILRRSEVLTIRRVHGGDLLLAGPDGDVGWKYSTAQNDNQSSDSAKKFVPSKTVSAPGGALSLPYWDTSASTDVALPDLVDIDFRIRSSVRPDFELITKASKGNKKRLLAVETWDKDLVLTCDDEFKLIRKLNPEEREVGLRLCWNRKEHRCSVFSESGEPLLDWKLPAAADTAPESLGLRNKTRDLTLEFLRIRKWDGNPPPKIDLQKPRVELADGTIVPGQILAGSSDTYSLQADQPDSKRDLPLASIDAIVFSSDPVHPATHEAVLSFLDGTLLMGRIDSIKDHKAALSAAGANQPLAANLDGLRQLRIDEPPALGPYPERPFGGLDQLVIQQTTFHGALVCDGANSPRWLPIGGVHPVTPVADSPLEITRSFPDDAKIPNAPALIYTSTGDVLPGNLVAVDRSGVEFDSSIVEKTKLSAEKLEAIQFGANVQTKVIGFDDPGWRILKGTKQSVRLNGNTLAMDAETSFAHPSIMQTNELKFKLPPASFSFIRLRLFCAGTDPAKSTNLIIGFQGVNMIFTGLEATEGQVSNQNQIRIPMNQPVEVRLVFQDNQVEVYVNDDLAQTHSVPSQKRAGAGLILEPASVWGNAVQPVSLSDFSTVSTPGWVWTPDVNTEVKSQALTIPRSRRESPPHHALLAANGDVLRGEINAMTLTHFGFLSGLETLRVPRDRVKAVLWLKKPLADAPTTETAAAVPESFKQPIRNRTRMNSASLSSVVSILQQQANDLKFKLPAKVPVRTFPMQFTGQTIGEALDQICAAASLRYHVDQAGVIVFEAVAKTPGLVEKTYWLQSPTKFPDKERAIDVLKAKGIEFPAGALATWKAEAAQLVVNNTPENQTKVAALLDSDFGGASAPPTHWLLLSNGARLALSADHFSADAITGQHPIYGRCTVPLSQVYCIRTSMPQSTPAMRSLENWHLAFAPEPVIPGAGTDAAPDLGKEAKSFKLPLLSGGDFELAKQKGKVVVLDFWATWCGPCIKALPGLIEAMSVFPADQVQLIGVNQGEAKEQVKRFLETRGWKLEVALDTEQSVGQQYGVDGIPHTVIIGPDGKIAWVKTGYTPDGEKEAADAVKKLLSASGSPAPEKPANYFPLMPARFSLVAAGFLAVAAQFARAADADELEMVQSVTLPSLRGVTSVAVTKDGQFLYSAAFQAGAITTFKRDVATGQLTADGTIDDDSLQATVSIRLSPDEKYAAAADFGANQVTVFKRDPVSGALTKIASLSGAQPNVRNGLQVVMDAEFSRDDRFVYAGAASGIVVLELKDDSLGFVELAQGDGEMRGVRGCIVSPDGHWVYATAHETGVLEAFKRNETTGKLELSQVLKNGQDDVASLARAFRVAESPDSKFLYVSSGRFLGDQAVGVYAVQPDGQLKVLQQLINGTDEFTEYEGGNSICASPDGKTVCAVASMSDRLFRFTRDAASGKLTFVGSQQAGTFATPGAAGLCFSPDGKFVYVADEKENSIEVFKLP